MWLKKQTKELKANTEFQVFSLTDEKLDGAILPLKIWLGYYKNILKLDELLGLFLDGLKENRKNES